MVLLRGTDPGAVCLSLVPAWHDQGGAAAPLYVFERHLREERSALNQDDAHRILMEFADRVPIDNARSRCALNYPG